VHFHEVGAVDAIVDIVGVCAGLEALGIDQLYASSVPWGEGWVDSMHGKLPVPAPATLQILAAVGAPMRPAPGPGEHVTPTGAALVAQLATFEQPAMKLARVGVGAGTRVTAWPNVARLILGEPVGSSALIQIETNIDDMNPQFYEAISQRLFAAGALDVWLVPVQMKKGRPGTILTVLAAAEREAALADLILRETTTLGLRVQPIHRHEGKREIRTIQTPLGPARVKLKQLGDEVVGVTPEYADVVKLAEASGLEIRRAWDIVYQASQSLLPK
jgi:pyridinium-3,5-bisthiocarboxylic acid mononucleotide nickel chelatase